MNCRSDIAEGLRLAARLFLLFFDKSRVIVLLSKQEGNTHLPDRMDLPRARSTFWRPGPRPGGS